MSPVRILVAPLRRKAKNSEILISKRSQDFLVIGGNVKKVAQGGSEFFSSEVGNPFKSAMPFFTLLNGLNYSLSTPLPIL